MLKYGSGYMLISVNENDFKDKVNIRFNNITEMCIRDRE